MVIDGRTILEKQLVTIPNDNYSFDEEKQVQPNGLDLRVTAISLVSGKAQVPRDSHTNYTNMHISPLGWKDGYVTVAAGSQYVVDFREEISVREGFCAIIVPRSSLLRSGLFITSALWDTGFQGQLGGSLRPLNQIEIEFGARLAQVVFFKSEFNGLRYEGRYQNTTSQTAMMK